MNFNKKIIIGAAVLGLCLIVAIIFTKTEIKMSSTKQILQELYNSNDAYVDRFMTIAQQTTITLDPFLLGHEYATAPYTTEEIAQIITTLDLLMAQQFSNIKPSDHKYYTACAGAPGSGKTFAIEKMYDINVASGEFYSDAIYIGPDSVVLPQMEAYKMDCADPNIGPLKAYEKWRAASNFIANFMMVKAMTDGLNIIHDTAAVSIKMRTILDVLGQEGYARRLHFFIADKDAREQALLHRKQKLGYTIELQATPTISKAESAFERLVDGTYQGRVDLIIFYAQVGDFYLGGGKSIPFAIYDPEENQHILILNNRQEYVDHILQQVDKNEGLKPELQNKVHEFVNTWVQKTDISNNIVKQLLIRNNPSWY